MVIKRAKADFTITWAWSWPEIWFRLICETYEPFISHHLANRFNQTAQVQSSKSFAHGGESQVSQLSTEHMDNLFSIQCDILYIPLQRHFNSSFRSTWNSQICKIHFYCNFGINCCHVCILKKYTRKYLPICSLKIH